MRAHQSLVSLVAHSEIGAHKLAATERESARACEQRGMHQHQAGERYTNKRAELHHTTAREGERT